MQIYRWVKKFETAGTINDMREKSRSRVGRKVTVRSSENIARVQESVARSPKKSLRKRVIAYLKEFFSVFLTTQKIFCSLVDGILDEWLGFLSSQLLKSETESQNAKRQNNLKTF